MNHIDILQSLGLARSALDDFIASVSGPKIKDLLRERDQLTWAINRVCDERLRLAAMDTSDAITQLDDIATDLEDLEKKVQNIGKAIGLVEKAVDVIAELIPAATGTFAAATPSAADLNKAHALLVGAAAHLSAHASALTAATELDAEDDEDEDEELFTAFCNRHNDLPPARVALEEALQIEDDHKKIPANKTCKVDIILVK